MADNQRPGADEAARAQQQPPETAVDQQPPATGAVTPADGGTAEGHAALQHNDPGGSEDLGAEDEEEEEGEEDEDDDLDAEDWLSEDGDELGLPGDWADDGDGSDWSDEEDDFDEDDWDEGMHSESSEEQADEERGMERLAAETAGRHVCPGWAAYAVPTTAHHFQSADALSAVCLPDGSGILAATFDSDGVAAWLLPPAGAMQSLGANQVPAAVRLGGFQAPRDIYSMSLSSDGRYIATGGESGLLTLYSVHPTAPPRPQLPPGKLHLTGLHFFYTPLLLPQQLRAMQAKQQQHGLGSSGEGQSSQQTAAASAGAQREQELASSSLQGGGLPMPRWYRTILAAGHAAGVVTDEEAASTQDYLQSLLGQDMSFLSPMELASRPAGAPENPQQLQQQQDQLALAVQERLNAALQRAGMAAQLLRNYAQMPGGAAAASTAVAAAAAAAAASGTPLLPSQLLGAHAQQSAQQAAAAQELRLQELEQRQHEMKEPLEQLEHQQRHAVGAHTFVSALAAHEPADPKGKQPLEEEPEPPPQPLQQHQLAATEQQQQQQPSQPGGQAAVMLRGLFALGMSPEQAEKMPFLSDGMCNGTRFGTVAGQQRLLAADQSGYVYVFNLPEPAGSHAAAASSSGSSSNSAGADDGELQAEQLVCGDLGPPSSHWRLLPVNWFRTSQHALGARILQQRPPAAGTTAATAEAAAAHEQDQVRGPEAGPEADATSAGSRSYLTAALGPFPCPCNLAVPSPDGRWIAVVGDSQSVFLVDQHAGFSWRQLPFDVVGSRERLEQDLQSGSQYAAWNASSTLLAVTSDALHAVFVFEPSSGSIILQAEGHTRPCLCVGFAPWDDRVLVYAEEAKNVHLRRVPPVAAGTSAGGVQSDNQDVRDDLADVRPGIQLLRLPVLPAGASSGAHPAGMGSRRRRITGLALTQQGDLLVSTKQGTVLRYLSSEGWSPECNSSWPVAFRLLVRTLLLCAHRQQAATGSSARLQAGLWSLPMPLVLHIAATAAGMRTNWLAPAAAQPAAA